MDIKIKDWKCNVCGSDDIVEYGFGIAYSTTCKTCGNTSEDVWEMAIHKDTDDKKLQEELKRIDQYFKGMSKEQIKEIVDRNK
ncbi:MAG: hypothetical protein ACRC92_27505 [Peptostreptococcaceae bacterium]